jgi:hypothetical protein
LERLLHPHIEDFLLVSLNAEIYDQTFESTAKNDRFWAESTAKVFCGVATLIQTIGF